MKLRPILLDLPVPIETPRLIIRPPQAGDGQACYEAIAESFEELHKWMPWAQAQASLDDCEEFSRQSYAKWILREDLLLWIYNKQTGEFLGGTGFHEINWDIPRFEIGYWLRTSQVGQGFVTEAVNGLTRYAFDTLKAKRIEIRCDEENTKSLKVAERCGYHLEALFKQNHLNSDQSVRNTCIYSRLKL